MADKIFNTRLKLRIDTHENWVTNNPVLLLGEVAICTVSVVQNGSVNSVPSTLMKVGDGTHSYNELDYVSAKAADVPAWAKAATKPSYTASEISGIDAYIGEKVQDSNTTYTITKVNDYQYKLMSKNIGDSGFNTEVATIDIPTDSEAVTQLRTDVDTLNGDASTEGSVNYKIAQAVSAIMDNPDETINSIKELVDWTVSHAQDALELSNAVSSLETKVGDSSVQSQINTAITGLNMSQYAKDSDLSAVAKSGLIDDLSIGNGTSLIFDCGTSV